MISLSEFSHLVENDRIVSSDNTVRKTLDAIQGKWRIYVIYELYKSSSQSARQIRAGIPIITNSILSDTLNDLMATGIVQADKSGLEAMYSLTEKGKDLLPAYYELYKWGEKYLQ